MKFISVQYLYQGDPVLFGHPLYVFVILCVIWQTKITRIFQSSPRPKDLFNSFSSLCSFAVIALCNRGKRFHCCGCLGSYRLHLHIACTCTPLLSSYRHRSGRLHSALPYDTFKRLEARLIVAREVLLYNCSCSAGFVPRPTYLRVVPELTNGA